MSEAILIVVGLGTAAFMLAMSQIMTAEASKAMDLRRVRVEAMRLRNEYAQGILSLRTESNRTGQDITATPDEELGEVEILDEEPRRAA